MIYIQYVSYDIYSTYHMIYTVRNILYIQYATDCIYSTYHDTYSTYQMIYTVSRKPGRSGSTEPDDLVLVLKRPRIWFWFYRDPGLSGSGSKRVPGSAAETVSNVVFLYSAPNQMSGLVHYPTCLWIGRFITVNNNTGNHLITLQLGFRNSFLSCILPPRQH